MSLIVRGGEAVTEIEKLYREYFNDIYLYIKAITHDEHIAEEITAETFFKALKSLDNFKGNCDIRVWLCQIAKNTYFSYLRKHNKTISIDTISGENFLLQNGSIHNNREESTHFDLEDSIINRDTNIDIHKYLHNLKEPYKEVFTLRVFAELSFKQIGELFGKTENWACVTYHRARSKIRDWIV